MTDEELRELFNAAWNALPWETPALEAERVAIRAVYEAGRNAKESNA